MSSDFLDVLVILVKQLDYESRAKIWKEILDLTDQAHAVNVNLAKCIMVKVIADSFAFALLHLTAN